MREWIAPKNPTYTIEANRVITDGSYREKVSGTSMGAMLGVNDYLSPFAVTTRLLGLWNEDISNKPAIVTGRMLEERIIDYLSEKHPEVGMFFKPEDLGFGVREGDHADWKSDFEDDVFSGHVDGIISKDGKDYILEIKTVNRKQIEEKGTWINGNIPKHYLWQVYLYNHFITKQDKAYFGMAVVDARVYENPNMWVANKTNCKLIEVNIDQKMVAETVEFVRQMYYNTVGKGVSVSYNPENEDDVEIVTHLRDISGTLPQLVELIQTYDDIKKSNKAHMDLIKDSLKQEDTLKDRIKDIMLNWEMKECRTVKIQTSSRKSFDFKQADADGFNYSKYLKNTTINSLKSKE